MITSKIIVSTLTYKVNQVTPLKCNVLLNILSKFLSSEELINELNILFIDNTYDVTTTENKININVTSYITQEHSDSVVKKLRAFIDDNIVLIDAEYFVAKLVKRRIY